MSDTASTGELNQEVSTEVVPTVTPLNIKPYIIKITTRGKEKDYLPVQARMLWYRDTNKMNTSVRILDKIIDPQAKFAYFELEVRDARGNIEVGVGSETGSDFGDYIEKAYTKAYGRALAALGYGTQFVGDEFDEGSRIVDAPDMKDTNTTTTRNNYQKPPATNNYQKPAPTAPEAPTTPQEAKINREQMLEITKLMKTNGLNASEVSKLTASMFKGKTRSLDLTESEAVKLIESLKKTAETGTKPSEE